MENAWYNLKVVTASNTNQVYFNNVLVGAFYATNNPIGRVGVSSRAVQLGIWEPQKGYFFIDDDELSFYAPEGQPQVSGKPLNMDYGYLKGFYTTLILPSVYVMNNAEASNMVTWINSTGLYSIISMDGGVARMNEGGSNALGRLVVQGLGRGESAGEALDRGRAAFAARYKGERDRALLDTVVLLGDPGACVRRSAS